MSNPPNVFPGDLGVAVVTGGHYAEPAPDQSGTFRIKDPLRHGQNVNEMELPFTTRMASATQAEIETFNPPPEPGTIIFYKAQTGDPTTRTAVGMVNERNIQPTMPGNSISPMDIVRKVQQKTTNKNRPPKIQQSSNRGAVVYDIKELGEWANYLTQGLSTHVAYAPMAGTFIDPKKAVDTAKQSFAGIPNMSSLMNLPGKIFNLSDILKNLNKNQKKRAYQNLDDNLIVALESIIEFLSQSQSGLITDRCDEETFIENIIQLLSQVTNFSDLITVIQKLQTDKTIRGLDKLTEIVVKANTEFGEIVQTLDINGNLKMDDKSSKLISSALQAISGLMNAAQAGAPGKSLYDKASSMVNNANQAIPPNIRSQIIKSTCAATKKHDAVHKACLGGNPLSSLLG